MILDIERTLAQWNNINDTITKLAQSKGTMSHREYCALMNKLYARKREVGAMLRSARRVTSNDLRVTARYNYES